VVVVDLGFGDAGKGTVVDWLCASGRFTTVVRYNGGAQAAHTVVLDDGRSHTFSQFGSGTLRGSVRTHLSRFVVVDPLALVGEAEHLEHLGVENVWDRLTVDREALLATPYHRAKNRARELERGADRHGSCGMGVGEAMAYAIEYPDDAPRVGDCRDPERLRHRLGLLRERLGQADPPVEACAVAFAAFAARVSIVDGLDLTKERCVFEGAQGVLLDEWHGFHPYTTWSTTTTANAETLLAESGAHGYRLGVLRTFTTRHGPGPLVTEDRGLGITDPNNPSNPWQGPFRVGHFDAVAHRYALDVNGGVDAVALTHLDIAARQRPALKMCVEYDDVTLTVGPPGDLDRQEALTRRLLAAKPVYVDGVVDWRSAVEESLGVPVVLTSWGPTARHKVAQPLSPVPAMPSTMRRWKNRYTSTSGSAPRIAEAIVSA
jgi:adenylosuccinate synthase